MLNLVLYSDQTDGALPQIDAQIVSLARGKRGDMRLGYIPSGPDPQRYFFKARKTHYARLGFDTPVYYDLDEPHRAEDIAELFACDAIHLSGGHTGDFLARLKRSGMLGALRDWASAGGVLIGVSAGAILMTPTIAVDALFLGEKPENVANGDALDLLPFEFFPHLGDDAAYLPALVHYSALTPRPILACTDEDGIVVTNGKVECFGKPVWIKQGAVTQATDIRLSESFFSQPA